MLFKAQVASLIEAELADGKFGEPETKETISTSLETPKELSHGDWAFPCFILSKKLKKKPAELAEQLKQALISRLSAFPQIESVSAVGPYLNFTLNKSAVAAEILREILTGKYLTPRESKTEKIMVEYSQPNTHKAFHVGHIRCAALGDTISRILEWTGYKVTPVNYLGDEGTHVAKCLWYLTEVYKGEIPETNRGEFLGTLYTSANDMVELGTLSRVPYPGVLVAEVSSVAEHPSDSELRVVTLSYGSFPITTVTRAKNVTPKQKVAFAMPDSKVGDRMVGTREVKGVKSIGMICTGKELGLSSDGENALILAEQLSVGTELAEVYKISEALPQGASVLGEWEKRNQAISKVLQKIEAGDPKLKSLWQETKEWSMKEFHEIYQWLSCRFDHYFFESEFGEAGKELVREYQKKGVFIESDGAIGADLSKYKLGFCIVLKSDGTANYATRDLALARKKFQDFKIDRSLYIVDAAQSFHFQQVFKCLALMGFPQAAQCKHVAYAQVVRPDGKMSSRKGNVFLFSQLKERLLTKIHTEFLDKYRGDWPDSEISSSAQAIALATMRYGMLSQENNSQVVFDLDEWASRTGNTGPYLLYACARISSMLREAGTVDNSKVRYELLNHEREIEVIMHLTKYHSCVESVSQSLSPHILCGFLFELSKKFNSMYQVCSVLNAETPELRAARIALVTAVKDILTHGLSLLGIRTLERM